MVLRLEYRGLKCAGKQLYPVLYEQGVGDTIRRFEQECRMLAQMQHPNIVQFIGVYYEEGSHVPILVMEFLPATLAKCIETYGVMPTEINYSILHDVALGLYHLHSQTPPIVHRDLSANNVLLASNMRAKISDLGVARILNLTPQQMSRMTSTPGTPSYMPPEVMRANPRYDASIDQFSYGILMIHVLSGKWPLPLREPNYVNPENRAQLLAVSEAERRDKYLQDIGNTHPLMDLILRCVSNDPEQRATAVEMVQRMEHMTRDSPPAFPNRVEMLQRIRADATEKGSLREEIEAFAAEYEQSQLEREELIQQHRAEVEQVRTEMRAQNEAHQTEMRALNETHQAELEQIRTEMRALNEAHQTEMRALNETHQAEVEEVHTEMRAQNEMHQAEMRAQIETHQAEIRAQNKAHRTEMRAQNKAHRTEMRAQNEAHQTEMRAQNETHQTEMRAQNETHQTEMRAQNEAHQTEMRTQNETHQTEMRTQNETHQTEMRTQNETHQAELEQICTEMRAQNEIHQADVEQIRTELTAELNAQNTAAQTQLSGEIERLKKLAQHRQEEIEQSEIAHSIEIAETRLQLQDALQMELRAQTETHQAEMRARNEMHRAEMRNQNETLQAEMRNQNETLQAEMRNQNETLQAEMRAMHEAKMRALNDKHQAEVELVRTEMRAQN